MEDRARQMAIDLFKELAEEAKQNRNIRHLQDFGRWFKSAGATAKDKKMMKTVTDEIQQTSIRSSGTGSHQQYIPGVSSAPKKKAVVLSRDVVKKVTAPTPGSEQEVQEALEQIKQPTFYEWSKLVDMEDADLIDHLALVDDDGNIDRSKLTELAKDMDIKFKRKKTEKVFEEVKEYIKKASEEA